MNILSHKIIRRPPVSSLGVRCGIGNVGYDVRSTRYVVRGVGTRRGYEAWVWGVGCGEWSMRCGLLGVRYKVWDTKCWKCA